MQVGEPVVACLNEHVYEPLVAEALTKLMHALLTAGKFGAMLRNDLKKARAPEVLFKVATVFRDTHPGVMHWTDAARDALSKRVADAD